MMPKKKHKENDDLRVGMSHCSEMIGSYRKREDKSKILMSMLEEMGAELKDRIVQSFMKASKKTSK